MYAYPLNYKPTHSGGARSTDAVLSIWGFDHHNFTDYDFRLRDEY